MKKGARETGNQSPLSSADGNQKVVPFVFRLFVKNQKSSWFVLRMLFKLFT